MRRKDTAALINHLPPGVEVEPKEAVTRLGEVIRKERQRRNLFISELATKAGVYELTVTRVEQGKHDARMNTLGAIIANVLGDDILRKAGVALASCALGRELAAVDPNEVQAKMDKLRLTAAAKDIEPAILPGKYLRSIREWRSLAQTHVAQLSGNPRMKGIAIGRYEESTIVPQYTNFLYWLNGVRPSNEQALTAWELYMQAAPSPEPGGTDA